jgi:tripartite-type tricarboxylate transporter receptor subunit TctC
MKHFDKKRVTIKGLVAAVAVTLAMPLTAQEVKLRRVELIVPYAPGGGSSIHGELFKEALEKTLPGNPTIIMRNVPGAGSVKGINEFHAKAKPDGNMVGSIASGTFFSFLVQSPEVKYPLTQFKPFLASPFGVIIYGRKNQAGGLGTDPIENIKKLQKAPGVYGGQNAISSDMPALVAFHLLKIAPKTLFGVSNKELQGAFQRGEVTINYDNMASYEENVKPMFADGSAVPLFTFGFINAQGKFVRDPAAPEIPIFTEVYEKVTGKALSGVELDIWKAMMAIRVMTSKALVLPVGTPQNIVDTYSEAARKAVELLKKDPRAQNVLGDYEQLTGKAAADAVKAAADMTPAQREWLRIWARTVHNVDF